MECFKSGSSMFEIRVTARIAEEDLLHLRTMRSRSHAAALMLDFLLSDFPIVFC